MFLRLLIVLAAVSYSTQGHPLETGRPHYYAKYFLNNRIVGGTDAPVSHGKHMAALLYGYPWVSYVCGGSIISKRLILTAAHCIDAMVTWKNELFISSRAVIGTNRWITGTNEVQFSGYVLHPEWDWDTLKNDIGLLKADEDIQTSDSVAMIPLKFDWMGGDVSSYVTGWGLLGSIGGLPDKLQLLHVKTLSHKECFERIDKVRDNWDFLPLVQEDIEICTLHSPGHGMCNGDSGSALVTEDTQEQIGIVSWGIPCAQGAPDVYARISGFEDWLRSNTQGHLG